MLEREDLRQVRSVVKDVLREDHLDKLPDLFGREHHKHRGTHDLTFQQLVDAPDYIDNRQFITIVNEDEDGMAFVDLLGTDHQIVVTKAADAWTLSLHHQVHIYSDEEAPRVRVTNLSDTVELDPVLQFGLGSLDLIQFTIGVDDSDSDKLKIANLGALGILAEPQGSYGERLVFVHAYDDDIDYVDLSDFSTDGVLVSTTQGSGDGQLCTTPKSIAYDGVYIYQADDTNNRVQKFDAATGTFIAKVAVRRPHGLCYWNGVLYCLTSTAALSGGTYYYQLHVINPDTMTITATYDYEQGQADDELSVPKGMCTDGTNLFICDTSAGRIKKTSLTGVYVNKVGSTGTGNGQFGASSPVDCEVDGAYLYVCDYGNKRIQIFDKGSLAYVGQHPTQTVGGFAGSPASIAINDTCYYVGVHNAVPNNSYIEKYDIATRAFQASYDTIVLGSTADTLWGIEIAKFASTGTKYGDLFVIHQDGSFIDHWPICRFMDDIRLVEGDDEDGDYVGLRAPAAVTASYTLTFPAAVPAAAGHFAVSTAGVISWGQDLGPAAGPSFDHAHLTVAIGTAPLVVTSTTVVANLNADYVDGKHEAAFVLIDGTRALTADWDAGSFEVRAQTFESDVATGTAPFVIASTTLVSNLNADFLDGLHYTSFPQLAISATAAPTVNDDIDNYREGCLWIEQDANKCYICVDNANGAAVWQEVGAGGGGGAFLDLTDVDPANYTGSGGYFVKVNAGETGLEFIASSVAAHDILSASHGDAAASAVSRGSTIYGNSTPAWAELTIGAAGTVLTSDGTDVAWAAPPGGSDPWTYVHLDSDFTTDLATAVNITGLAFTPAANKKYHVKWFIAIQPTENATVAGRVGFTYPSGLNMACSWATMATSASAEINVYSGLAADSDWVIAGSANGPSTSGDYPVWGEMIIVAGATPSGDVQARLRSEAAGYTVTARIGSFLSYRLID